MNFVTHRIPFVVLSSVREQYVPQFSLLCLYTLLKKNKKATKNQPKIQIHYSVPV